MSGRGGDILVWLGHGQNGILHVATRAESPGCVAAALASIATVALMFSYVDYGAAAMDMVPT